MEFSSYIYDKFLQYNWYWKFKDFKENGNFKELSKSGYKILTKTKAKSLKLKRESLLTDCYITGTNAISIEGHIVKYRRSGNRVDAMLYGPKRVILVIGTNKICKTLKYAIYRVKTLQLL